MFVFLYICTFITLHYGFLCMQHAQCLLYECVKQTWGIKMTEKILQNGLLWQKTPYIWIGLFKCIRNTTKFLCIEQKCRLCAQSFFLILQNTYKL
ncbi:hypothetical protein GDO81_009913 [Engystomops pustulosus]|uniref:Secreted protein n=1 Tax=Engystomops pustulosus TaxID=76066 RepID=A0AAV7BVD8_ENGPU|nr:hypothetical protein GDO81_009913 [Engystomops pustulosus]